MVKSHPLLSGEALTWWLVGASVFVLLMVFTVYEMLNHERTKTAAAPYAFHVVGMPQTTPSTTVRSSAPAALQRSTQSHAKPMATSTHPPQMHHSASPSHPAEPHTQFSILSSRQRARLISRYVTYWIEHVEEKASGQLQNQEPGKIKVRVTVVSSGQLAGLALLHSTLPGTESSRAVELIRAASPYAPFPENLAKQANKLIIHCTMHFMNGEKLGTTPSSTLGTEGLGNPKANLGKSLSQALLGGDS